MSDDWAGVAFVARNDAVEWQNYARKLEQQLLTVQADKAGMVAVKDAALKELARVDPHNYLLVQENRKRIWDAAYTQVASGKRAT